MNINDLIQTVIALGILLTVLVSLIMASLTNKNIQLQKSFFKEQKKYFENETRPWVAPEIKEEGKITEGKILFTAKLTNPGKSPAQEIIYCSELTNCEDYPVDKIKKKLETKKYDKTALIFPNQQIEWEITVDLNKNNLKIPRDVIIGQLKSKEWYLHLYIHYKSESEDYYLQEIFQVEYLGTKTEKDEIIDGFKWLFKWSSLDSLCFNP